MNHHIHHYTDSVQHLPVVKTNSSKRMTSDVKNHGQISEVVTVLGVIISYDSIGY